MPALIIWGFIYHYFTFKLIPITDVLYLVFGYLTLATLTIVFMHVYDMGKVTEKLRYVRLFAPLLLQFAIGSMIGGVFIFYWFAIECELFAPGGGEPGNGKPANGYCHW